MKLNDLSKHNFKNEGNGAFDKFADKLNKIKKQLIFEEEYKKIKDRQQRYLDRKKLEEEKKA